MSRDLKNFVEACARGNSDARIAFQEEFGALIYSFPVRIYHLSPDEAGDFYVYVFENERIFKRMSTFQGRNNMQFTTYLSYYVLRDLFFEWQRSMEHVNLVSLQAPLTDAADDERARTMQEVLPAAAPTPEHVLEDATDVRAIEAVLTQLEPEKRLVLKLLALSTVELAPEDIRAIAQLAGRSLRDTLLCLEEVGTAVATKAMKAEDKWQTFHTVAHWIQTYQHQITGLVEQLQSDRVRSDPQQVQKLTHDKAELERKLTWRYEQQARLREELHKLDLRPSYKDIANLLNLPLGTICSKIARAREEFAQKLVTVRAAHPERG